MASGSEVIGVGGATSACGGVLCANRRDLEWRRTERGEVGGGDFSSALVGIAATKDNGFGRGLGGCSGFVKNGDEDFRGLLFSNLCGFFGEDFEFGLVFGFVRSVVEVEGSW